MIVSSSTIARLWLIARHARGRCRRTRACPRSRAGRAPPRPRVALPEHSNATVYGSATGRPIGARGSSSGAITRGRADRERALAPQRRGLRDRDVVDAARAQHRGGEQADRTAAGDEHAVVGRRAREVDGVDRDRGRLGERGGARRQRVGDAQQPRRGDDLVAAERAA